MEIEVPTQKQVQQYLAEGYWQPEIPLDYLYRYGEETPTREFLVDSKKRLTFAETVKMVQRMALKFHELGIREGDRVGIQLPLCVDAELVELAFSAIGAVNLRLHLRSREADWGHLLDTTKAVAMVIPAQQGDFDFMAMAKSLQSKFNFAKHIFVSGDQGRSGMLGLDDIMRENLETKYPAEYIKRFQPQPSKLRLIMSSSGTTGKPKFTQASYYPFVYFCRSLAERFGLNVNDVALVISPGGPGAVLSGPALLCGSKIVFLERFDAESALEVAQRENATVIGGTATQFIKMAEVENITRKYDLASLRMVTNAAASLPPEVAQRIEKLLGVRVMNIYGTTDAGVPASTSLKDPRDVTLRTAGKPLPGVEIRIVSEEGDDLPAGEIGEIVWQGPCMYGGYYENASLNKKKYKNGWYFSGDLGSLDSQGYLTVGSRKDYTINRGGQKVSPVEVEEFLYLHPKVKEAVVVPMPDRILGQKGCAYVVPREGETFTFDEMVQFLKSKGLAVYKFPERLEVLKELPVTGGIPRVMRNTLIEDVTNKLKKEGVW
jgi:2,3-dihydroxybenzoate-AMP ligase